MKYFTLLIFAMFFTKLSSIILVPNKSTKKERQLLFGPSKTEQLEEETHRKRKMQQLKLVIANMNREDEIRGLEAAMNEIGNSVEEINETMNAKLSEFTDMIERLRYQKMAQRKIYRLPDGN
jgi:hypothetical protein